VLHTELEASLDYIARFYLKSKIKQTDQKKMVKMVNFTLRVFRHESFFFFFFFFFLHYWGLNSGPFFYFYFIFFYYSYVHTRLGSLLPPAPTPMNSGPSPGVRRRVFLR
jgi:hypothetical protein